MSRPKKCRRICSYPDYRSFMPGEDVPESWMRERHAEQCAAQRMQTSGMRKPGKAVSSEELVVMTLDEFETIRLMDACGLTQEECAEEMQVARTTVTAVYDSARRKIAEMLVEGKRLMIAGGRVRLRLESFGTREQLPEKGENTMRIAVCYEDGMVFQHFGRTERFKLYELEDGAIKSAEVVDTAGAGHGALAGFLKEAGADVLICGGIGGGARMALQEAGIRLYPGAAGEADAAVQAFAAGKLEYDPDTECHHHAHGGENGEHSCGHHGGNGESHGCGHHGEGGESHHCGHHA